MRGFDRLNRRRGWVCFGAPVSLSARRKPRELSGRTLTRMNTKLVALVLIVALVATGIGTGLAVLLSR